MATIYHQVGIKAPLQDVYRAIATTEGVSGWWTDTRGEAHAGGDLEFVFGGHVVRATVTANTPDACVEWRVSGDAGEWLDTRICFDLEKRPEQVLVNFRHTDWREATLFMAHCSTKWAVFLLSLKDYLETGAGRPFPDDIHINHTDFS